MKPYISFLLLPAVLLSAAACSSDHHEKAGVAKATEHPVHQSAPGDTTPVSQADSTHSFRNDRGTDSVTAGKPGPLQQ